MISLMGETRLCARCRRQLPTSDFNFRDRAQRLLQSYCRECSNANWREWYSIPENRARHLSSLKARRRRRYERNRDYIRRLKSVPCADCMGSFPPEAMDFDHLDDKIDLISKMVYQVGFETLERELSKCEVVCANCHRMRTTRRLRDVEDRDG